MSHLLLFFTAFLLACGSVLSAPATTLGPTIPNAGGVALSADGTRAFVSTTATQGSAVYVIPLPITSSSNFQPQPYWTTSSYMQIYYIAASLSASPQLVYLLDNQNARLLSLVINTASPASNYTTVYSFGTPNVFLINGMYYQASSNLLFFSCYDHFGGSTYDFIAFLDPTASSPTLTTLYSTPIIGAVAGLAVSSTYLYYGIVTSPYYPSEVASIWRVPLTAAHSTALILNGTQSQLLYTTADADLSTVTLGDLIWPAALVLSADESVLYMTDIGNGNVQASATPHAVYALWPLYSLSTPLNLTGLYEYEGLQVEVQQSLALSPDQGTLYWAATGTRNGFYTTVRANSSITFPPRPPANATGPTASPTPSPSSSSATRASSSSSLPRTSSAAATSVPSTGTVSPTSGPVLLPVGTVSTVTSFSFSDLNDGLSCLSADASGHIGFSASDGGDIFTWSMGTPSTSPAAVIGYLTTSFIDCQADPSGTALYLLDTRGLVLYRWLVAQPGVTPVVVASFPDEVIGSLTALTIDFSTHTAYVGTRSTDYIYTVNVSRSYETARAFNAYPVNSDVTALTLSADGRTLYYATPSVAQGAPATINALAVQGGVIVDSSSPVVFFGSTALIYPDSLLFNGSTLYVKDGGAFHGEQEPGQDPQSYQTLYALALPPTSAAALHVLFTTNQFNLPPGLLLAADGSRVFFASTETLDSVLLRPEPAPPALPSSSAGGTGAGQGTGQGTVQGTGGVSGGGVVAEGGSSGLSGGAIGGIVVGGVVGLLVVVVLLVLCRRGGRSKNPGGYADNRLEMSRV